MRGVFAFLLCLGLGACSHAPIESSETPQGLSSAPASTVAESALEPDQMLKLDEQFLEKSQESFSKLHYQNPYGRSFNP